MAHQYIYCVFGHYPGTSSIDWAQLSRPLPEDGDRNQSPTLYVLNNN
jgi:hypothetical protein